MNKNIIVVGANQTGLVFAAFAKTAGFDVTVYEAKKQCDVAYDWTDDMVEETFEEVYQKAALCKAISVEELQKMVEKNWKAIF